MSRFNFKYGDYVDPIGRAGGLALWWTEDAKVKILSASIFCFGTPVELGSGAPWFFTFIYGNPHRSGRNKVWDLVKGLRQVRETRWCCMGDFNAIKE
ncbi:hypothetical protein REPUB_Repub14bG0010200 [Reevesia pubescens]